MNRAQQVNTAQAHSCCRGTSRASPAGSRWSRYLPAWLCGRRGLTLGAAVAVALGGAAFGWPWLVAAGLAPILLALAPCAAVCALGYCMRGKGNRPATPQDANANAAISTVAPAVLGNESEPLPPRQTMPEREQAALS